MQTIRSIGFEAKGPNRNRQPLRYFFLAAFFLAAFLAVFFLAAFFLATRSPPQGVSRRIARSGGRAGSASDELFASGQKKILQSAVVRF
jgi:hypothetical protein